jgi:hypothetical protein
MNENHYYKGSENTKQGEGEILSPVCVFFFGDVCFANCSAVPCKMSSPKCFAQLTLLSFFLPSSSTNFSDCIC